MGTGMGRFYLSGGCMRTTGTFCPLFRIVFSALAVLSFAGAQLAAQPIPDTKGRDFLLTFPPNFHNDVDSPITDSDSLYIFIAAVAAPTHGTIRYRDINGTERTHSFTIVDASKVYTFGISWSRYELVGINNSGDFNPNHQSGQIAPQSFRVTTDRDVTVYALDRATTTSDAMLVLPVDVLGRQYRIMAYHSDGRDIGSTNIDVDWRMSTPSQFAVVASRSNTIVTITPTAPVVGPANSPFSITLNEGDVYLLQAAITVDNLQGDLTGTLIEASQPVAVFSGHQRSLLPVNATQLSSRDYLIEQMPPVSTWGKSYILTPFPLPPSVPGVSGAHDIVRVLAAYDNTSVVIDGTERARLQAGEFYEAPLQNAALLTASQDVLVAQYKRSAQASGGNTISDPFMILVPPRKQFLPAYLCINAQAFDNDIIYMEQYCTIICPTDYIHTVTIDGTVVPKTLFREVPHTCYSYAWVPVEDGSHNIEAQKPIGLYIYGYGFADSYGYVGGMAYTTFEEEALIASGDTAICVGDSVQLYASGGSTFRWSPGTGLSCTDCPDPVAKPAFPTHYTVTMTDTLGCVYEFSTFIDVQPPAVAVVTGDTLICTGQTALLHASGGLIYEWSPAEGLSCTDCPNPTATPAQTTTYTVKVSRIPIVEGSTCVDTGSVTVTMVPAAFADLPEDTLLCAKDALVLDLPDENTYNWFPPTGISCTDCRNPVIKPAKTTKYTVTMFNKAGCRMTKTMTVTVVDLPIVSITPDIALCEADPPVRLLAKGGNFYRWSPADGLSCTDCAGPLAKPDKTTTYTVDISINATCVSTTTVTVSILPSPVATVSQDTTICPDTPARLTASGGSSYRWSPADGLSCSNCSDPTALPVESTTYYVEVGNPEGCSTSDSIRVTVRRPADITVMTAATICNGDTTQLTASGGSTYQWSPPDGLSCTDCAAPLASPQNSTVYTVSIDNGDGCSVQREVTVTVLPLPELSVSNDTTICRSGAASLHAAGEGTITWSPPDGLSCTDCAAPVATPATSTRYYATLDNGACRSTDSVLVTVKPCGLAATLTAAEFGSLAVCDSAAQQCTLVNTGLEPFTIVGWELTGADAASFTAELPGVTTPLTLAIGDSLHFRVSCRPLREGPLTAGLSIATHDRDFVISNICSGEGYKRTAMFDLGPDIRTAPGSRLQIDLQAQSDEWSDMDISSLEFTLSYKSTWMRYGGLIQRGPALDNSWTLSAREEKRFNGEHAIVVTASGGSPITANGTIATLTVEPLLTNEFVYTPRIDVRAIGREDCVGTEGGTVTLDITFCAAQLRPVRYSTFDYSFEVLNGSIVPGNDVRLRYVVALAADARIEVYNQLGELVADYHRTTVQPGEYGETLDLSHLAAGVYLARFSSGPYSRSVPLLIGAE